MTTLASILAEDAPATVWPGQLGDHLSASQLTMFQRCPEQFRRRYILRQFARPGAALVWGAADHFAHETNFRQKITTGTDLDTDTVKDAFAEGFEKAIDRNGGTAEVEWGDDKPADLKDKGVMLVEAYHRQVSPSVQPTSVEQKFEVRVAGVPVPIIGFVDVETDSRAIERKTSKQKASEIKPDWRIQGLLYQAVVRKPVEWHVSVKTKTPSVYTPETLPGLRLEHSPGIVRATGLLVGNLAQAMLAYWATFGPDQPWPGAITHPWACGFCGFRPSCAWWQS